MIKVLKNIVFTKITKNNIYSTIKILEEEELEMIAEAEYYRFLRNKKLGYIEGKLYKQLQPTDNFYLQD